ncbi:pre-mRNA-splicing factor SYF1 [Iris pallida]|uniref:Pre-mRNA-splicing factor SYF1 n=1 Tax=Iris pallida TaxID=29817 RepID=A0AAX6F5J1_IRIPA|nr:pre-mRNA-splicing factor SYF1 [Iris pallida]
MVVAKEETTISSDMYPSPDDLPYEEEVLRDPCSVGSWWRYLAARSRSPFAKRSVLYERALRALPGSYKLWHAYLRERLDLLRPLPVSHPAYASLNDAFERALLTMHKMPRVWSLYLRSLADQRLLTRARRALARALRALPVAQHARVWAPYLALVSLPGVPPEASLRAHRRYLLLDPSHVDDFIRSLLASGLWQEAAHLLASVLNDSYSSSAKSKHQLWLELCDLLAKHAADVSGLDADAIIRGGIRRSADEAGRLWTSLADYYVRRGLYEKARDVFEEGLETVVTARDFSVVFESYAQFEQSALAAKLETMGASDGEGDGGKGGRGEDGMGKLAKSFPCGFWLYGDDDGDTDLRLARLEHLIDRRPELLNSVLLRQNPHDVERWHRRVKLFEGNPTKQIKAFTEAVLTVDPMKAVGKPHTLWVAFAKLYEKRNEVANARVIFDKAVQLNYKTVDNLATVFSEWAELELRHKNFKGALELMRRATAEPSVEVKRRVAAAAGNEPVQMKLHKSLRLWSFVVDLEESLGTLESTRAVYERILDLRIATPQIILNYALLLEEHKYFEDAFKVYERGVKIFKYPHVKDLWVTYLSKFVKRYGRTELERARELFEHAVEKAPAEDVKPIYLQYAKLEEDYGLAKRAMKVYDQAVKAVPNSEKLNMYEIYIARAAEIFGVPKTREIYEQAIESGLPDNDVKTMCLKYAELERSLGEIDRARAIYVFSSQFSDPRSDPGFWKKWNDFKVQHGNEDTFREMLRIRRSVLASYSQKDKLNLEEAADTLKRAGIPEDEMAAMERQLAPQSASLPSNDAGRKLNFVRAGAESQADNGRNIIIGEDIELPDESDEEDEKFELAQKDVPAAVFGHLVHKVSEDDAAGEKVDNHLGALERIKRQRLQ